jgi:hypothetical protein
LNGDEGEVMAKRNEIREDQCRCVKVRYELNKAEGERR